MKKQNENTTQNAPPAGGEETILPEGVTLTELQAENEQLKATIRLNAAHRQITGELAKAGARSPELLWDALEKDLQFADDGTLQNAAALIQNLKTAHPEQFGFLGRAGSVGSIDAGAGITAAPQLTRDALAKMTAAEIAELDWADVRQVLAGS